MRKIIPITVLAGTAAAVGIIHFASDESATSSIAPSTENTTVSGTVAPTSSAAPSVSSRPAPTISSSPQEEAPARTKLAQRPATGTQAAPALTAMPAAPSAAQAPAASPSPVLPNPAAGTAAAGYEISGQTGTDRPVAAQPTHRPATSGFGPAIAPPAVAAQAPATTVAPAPIASAAVTPTEANASKANAANRKSTPSKLVENASSPTRIDLTSPAPASASAAPAVVPSVKTATAATDQGERHQVRYQLRLPPRIQLLPQLLQVPHNSLHQAPLLQRPLRRQRLPLPVLHDVLPARKHPHPPRPRRLRQQSQPTAPLPLPSDHRPGGFRPSHLLSGNDSRRHSFCSHHRVRLCDSSCRQRRYLRIRHRRPNHQHGGRANRRLFQAGWVCDKEPFSWFQCCWSDSAKLFGCKWAF